MESLDPGCRFRFDMTTLRPARAVLFTWESIAVDNRKGSIMGHRSFNQGRNVEARQDRDPLALTDAYAEKTGKLPSSLIVGRARLKVYAAEDYATKVGKTFPRWARRSSADISAQCLSARLLRGRSPLFQNDPSRRKAANPDLRHTVRDAKKVGDSHRFGPRFLHPPARENYKGGTQHRSL